MRTRALWMLGLAFLLAATSVYLTRDWLNKQLRDVKPVVVEQAAPPIDMTTVVVATTPLGFGSRIRKEHLRLADWPSGAVPQGAFTTIEELLGEEEERVALRPVSVNEPVLREKVSGFGGKATLSALINEDMRAATIRVNDVLGVAGFILPGDRVDILLTRDINPESGNKITDLITDILLQNVRVLGIDQDANEGRDKPAVVRAVTLEVTPEQAQKLALASQVGTLSLMLRNVVNVEADEVKTVGFGDLRVGEANLPAQEGPEVVVKEVVKEVVVVKTTPKKDNPAASVRIVRGTESTKYDVQPELIEPMLPPVTKPLNLGTGGSGPAEGLPKAGNTGSGSLPEADAAPTPLLPFEQDARLTSEAR